jgi:hypothetical protein
MEVALAGESIRLVEEIKSSLLTHNRAQSSAFCALGGGRARV